MKKIYGGRYGVTKEGVVYSFVNNRGNIVDTGKVKKTQILNTGYEQVQFLVDGERKVKSVHRLVAENFIVNTDSKPVVNHKDGNKTNNHVSNLEWMTRSENDIHAFKTGLRVPCLALTGIPNDKLSQEVHQIKDGVIVKTWKSMAEAQRAGFSQGNIGMCCSGIRKSHKGFEWEKA